jgi:hypothetical protein
VSTCPRCRQYLGEDHRCPRWVRWRRPTYRVLFAVLGGVTGGLIGSVIGPPFDVIFIPIAAFAGYKLVPKGRHARG